MTKLVQRSLPDTSPGAVDRAMRSLSLKGIRRSKGVRTTILGKDGRRAGDLLNRDFTAAAPNRTWVMDFERHEALPNRAVMEGRRLRLVAASRP
jgi:putative transposase